MDVLSDTLRAIRLAGAIFIQARWTAPWCFASPRAATLAPRLEPGAERVVIFHLLTAGTCTVEAPGAPPVFAQAGDVILLPHGNEHRIASGVGLSPDDKPDLDELLSRRPYRFTHGGGGAPTDMVCGYLACDDRFARQLLSGLPPIVAVPLRGSDLGQWIEASIAYALKEALDPRPGGTGVLAKLAELLFIEVLRTYLAEQGAARTGWLAGLGDRIVGAALAALHERPAHAWTLGELAKRAATSRSVLAARFQQIVGESPMQYLTRWRMVLAAHLLSHGNDPLARIAEQVGYQTDTAFSRAFRREYGAPPAAWRRSRQRASAG